MQHSLYTLYIHSLFSIHFLYNLYILYSIVYTIYSHSTHSLCMFQQLDEEVARLHLDHIGAKLTQLSEVQCSYLGLPKEGPYKPDMYRY
ncbi:hypothetical protein EB796_007371 [Bugula neritina]|uniref:Adenosylhomocysteinase n=1 Tax=Bugula neritina TaxID=10212 RepID=A0A7J7K6S6_BUGNE|nr:hypothetical protein EB796_007371 [Bugula neritina]